MAIGNNTEWGNRRDYPYQLAVLKLLDQISSSISSLPGVDYETRTTMYQATAPGPGYVIGDIIVRYDIIDVATSTLSATIWFNQTTQVAIAAPAPANLVPIAAPSSVMVNNGAGGAAVNIQDGGNSITVDNANLDVALSTRASEATLATRASEATLATRASEATLATMLTLAGFQARINTLGQKTMAASTPVVLASDQSAIPVTLPTAPATSTNTSVARATTVGGVLILAANALRKGATIANNTGAILYIKFAAIGGTSATSFTARLVANAYIEIPFGYTGDISGIWASAGAGTALVSELT